MAHAGKYYPVHFRRDLNLNQSTNNFGLARAYAVRSSLYTGTVGVPLNSKRIICHAVDEPTFQFAKWESEWFTCGTRTVRWLLECSLAKGYPTELMRVQIFDQVIGLLGYSSIITANHLTYRNLAGAWVQASSTHPDLLYGFVNSTRNNVDAVDWAEYNGL